MPGNGHARERAHACMHACGERHCGHESTSMARVLSVVHHARWSDPQRAAAAACQRSDVGWHGVGSGAARCALHWWAGVFLRALSLRCVPVPPAQQPCGLSCLCARALVTTRLSVEPTTRGANTRTRIKDGVLSLQGKGPKVAARVPDPGVAKVEAMLRGVLLEDLLVAAAMDLDGNACHNCSERKRNLVKWAHGEAGKPAGLCCARAVVCGKKLVRLRCLRGRCVVCCWCGDFRKVAK